MMNALQFIIHHSEFLIRLHTTFLRWPAAIVGQRGDIFDGLDVQAGGLQSSDGGLAAGAWAFHADLDFLESELGSAFGGYFGGALGGKGRALAAALEANRTGRSVAERIAIRVGDGDNRVVKRRHDVGDAPTDIAPGLALLTLCHEQNSCD